MLPLFKVMPPFKLLPIPPILWSFNLSERLVKNCSAELDRVGWLSIVDGRPVTDSVTALDGDDVVWVTGLYGKCEIVF